MTTFYISDPHYAHVRIIELAKRPFKNVDEMDIAMIRNWNTVVGHGDTIRCLGDFARRNPERYFNQLNGEKHLVKGNHDHTETRKLPWASVKDYDEVMDDGQLVILFHYPIMEWNKLHGGSIHLYGHVHGKPLTFSKDHHGRAGKDPGKAYDVGAEMMGYVPRTLKQIVAYDGRFQPNQLV